MIPNLFQPQKVHAMAAIWLLPLTFVVYYFVFKFCITKWNLPTPGRGAAAVHLYSKQEYRDSQEAKENESGDSLEKGIIEALGGKDNIESVSCCATRLRVTLKDASKVKDDAYFKNHLEAMGVVHGDDAIQIIYGVRVQNIATRVKDVLGMD